jgi:ribosome-associated protein
MTRGDDDLEVLPGVVVPARELRFSFSRSGGPGGQNVNKVETRVQLRFAPAASSAFDERQRQRLLRLLAPRLTRDGELVLACDVHRERERNRAEVRGRLRLLLAQALTPPKKRVKTRPTRASKERRLEAKRRGSERKRARRAADGE